jgi:primosomal protein N' (replication factor Y)
MADATFNLPDFRAFERAFQSLTQVSGRAGRADRSGEVLVQTMNSEHPVLKAIAENNWKGFYEHELEQRKLFGFTPFRRLVVLKFQYKDEQRLQFYAEDLCQRLRAYSQKNQFTSVIQGPAKAPLAKVKNIFRWQCLIKSENLRELRTLIQFAEHYTKERKSPISLAADVDPVSTV